MSRRAARLVVLLGLAGALAACSGGSEPARTGPPAALLSPLAFEPPRLELPLTHPGGFADGTVTIRNVTSQDARIESVRTSCDCTTAELDLPHDLAAGATLDFPVRLELGELARGGLPLEPSGSPVAEVEREVLLIDAAGRVARLPVTGRITERVRIEPPALDLGRVILGEVGWGRFQVLPGREQRTDLHLIEARADEPALEATYRTDGPGEAVEVSWGPIQEPGAHETVLHLRTDIPDEPPLALRVRVLAVPRVWVDPPAVEAFGVKPNTPVVRILTLHSAEGVPFQITSTSTRSTHLKHSLLSPRKPGEQRIQLVVPVPPWPREVESELVIQTDVRGAGPLVVPVHVQARGPADVER